MILIQDQREKRGKHDNIEHYCRKISLPIIRKRLDVGDYMLADYDSNGGIVFRGNISVDIKGGGLLELANDLYRDKKQFNKKYKKCYYNNIHLIVLIEENNIKSIDDLIEWKDERTRITGRYIYDLMKTLELSYGVKFVFCEKSKCGEKLIKILIGE